MGHAGDHDPDLAHGPVAHWDRIILLSILLSSRAGPGAVLDPPWDLRLDPMAPDRGREGGLEGPGPPQGTF